MLEIVLGQSIWRCNHIGSSAARKKVCILLNETGRSMYTVLKNNEMSSRLHWLGLDRLITSINE
jgi:hypothetical protein